MCFVDGLPGLRRTDASRVDSPVTGIEKHRLVAIALGRSEGHAGPRSEGRCIERLTD